jgi:hypothetical protein
MIRKFSLFGSLAVATLALVAMSGAASATSDRCIELEQQFDAVAGEHASDPKLPLAQSYREKGSYLCNNDVDDVGEEQLEQALRLLGVEPDPEP